ncbi:hypothetical protein CR513_33096, partial [Mucuna pruriens]
MEFVTSSYGIFMHQKRYAIDILKIFHMLGCNYAQTLVDLVQSWRRKEILRYVKHTLDYRLLFSKYGRNVSDKIFGYCDFD